MTSFRIVAVVALVVVVGLTAGSLISLADQPATSAATKMAGLPKPKTDGGMPLMEALKKRQTSRQFADRKLPDQVLSNMLWAACGVNREDGKRTAPTAVNCQEIDVYVAKADGLWLFDAKANDLKLVLDKDIRALTGKQEFVKDAAVNLIFVADFAKMGGPMAKSMTEADKVLYSAADTGFVSQNVYLFCASEGLATVFRGAVDQQKLNRALRLESEQFVAFAQTVGYPPS